MACYIYQMLPQICTRHRRWHTKYELVFLRKTWASIDMTPLWIPWKPSDFQCCPISIFAHTTYNTTIHTINITINKHTGDASPIECSFRQSPLRDESNNCSSVRMDKLNWIHTNLIDFPLSTICIQISISIFNTPSITISSLYWNDVLLTLNMVYFSTSESCMACDDIVIFNHMLEPQMYISFL
jgi:hypothetical protein